MRLALEVIEHALARTRPWREVRFGVVGGRRLPLAAVDAVHAPVRVETEADACRKKSVSVKRAVHKLLSNAPHPIASPLAFDDSHTRNSIRALRRPRINQSPQIVKSRCVKNKMTCRLLYNTLHLQHVACSSRSTRAERGNLLRFACAHTVHLAHNFAQPV